MFPRTLSPLLVVAGGLALATACTYPYTCPYGTFPMDGATGVPLDVVIELRASDLPRDMPSPERAVTLETIGGRNVPVDARVVDDVVYVTPRRPLDPDTGYQIWGLDEPALGGRWRGDLGNTAVYFGFHTSGTPSAVALARQDDETVLVSFTEPVELDSLQSALRANEHVEATVLRRLPDAEHMVEVHLEPYPRVVRLTLREGATTLDGRPVSASGRPLPVAIDSDGFIQRHRGRPTCE